MPDNSSNNKRIAKNTILLYLRMMLMMVIGIYTSRVILNALGVSDLGLYNVVGGVVSMFTFLNGTLSSGGQRFMSYSIGEHNALKLKEVFRTTMTLHIWLAVVIVLLCETIGLWYVYNKLNVEPDRFYAALWCYQLSIVAMALSIVQVPYNSAIIAHEKMDIYAYMSILDVSVKLLVAYLIIISPFDRLIFYAMMILVATVLSTIIYILYCRRKFVECRFGYGYDKTLMRDMLGFCGWNTIGCFAIMGQTTGLNLVINAFCGTVVNGARAIAFQVNGMVMKFIENFQMALNPHIIKYYADGDMQNMERLVIRGAYLSSYLFLFLAIPLFIECEYVITLWLGSCPDYVVPFIQIVLIESLFKSMGNPTITAMHATGKMKMVQITVGLVQILVLPVCYLLFRLGLQPVTVVACSITPWLIVIPMRLYWCNHYCGFPVKRFFVSVCFKIPAMAILMALPPYLVYFFTPLIGFAQFAAVGVVSVISNAIFVYTLGLEPSVRSFVNSKILSFISKFKK